MGKSEEIKRPKLKIGFDWSRVSFNVIIFDRKRNFI